VQVDVTRGAFQAVHQEVGHDDGGAVQLACAVHGQDVVAATHAGDGFAQFPLAQRNGDGLHALTIDNGRNAAGSPQAAADPFTGFFSQFNVQYLLTHTSSDVNL